MITASQAGRGGWPKDYSINGGLSRPPKHTALYYLVQRQGKKNQYKINLSFPLLARFALIIPRIIFKPLQLISISILWNIYHIWNRNICFFEMINWFFTAQLVLRHWDAKLNGRSHFLCLAKKGSSLVQIYCQHFRWPFPIFLTVRPKPAWLVFNHALHEYCNKKWFWNKIIWDEWSTGHQQSS